MQRQFRGAEAVGDSVIGELPVPMIATRDIAEMAANALTRRDWKGIVVRELLGERDLSHVEATRIIGERIGKPDLHYMQFSEEDETNDIRSSLNAIDCVNS